MPQACAGWPSSTLNPYQTIARNKIDIAGSQDDDFAMNTPADRDYINAKAEAIAATLAADAREYQAKTDVCLDAMNTRLDTTNTRLDALDQTMQLGFKSLREEISAQLAQLEARILRSQTDHIKWMVGAIFAGLAVSTSVTVALINNAPSKSAAPTPVVIYTQPNAK